jgi:hypothetical protein
MSVLDDNEDLAWGPAMQSLSPRRRAYVLAQLSDPLANPTVWARRAGFSDKGLACKVRGHQLEHDEKVMRAVQEVVRQHLESRGPAVGVATLLKIAQTDGHPQQVRAAEGLLDRTGFHAMSEHKVLVERRDPAAMIARVRELAAQFGIDADELLTRGRMKALAGGEAPVIEHEAPATKAD